MTHHEQSDRPMVVIGRIAGLHGLHGVVKIVSYSDVPGRFEKLTQVEVATAGASPRTLSVSMVRSTGKGYLVAFESIETSEQAAFLLGGFVQIEQETLVPLPEGEYYECDLVGMSVSTEEGTPVGLLAEVFSTKSNVVFVVKGQANSEHLIPGTKEIVREVDVTAKRMIIRRIPGLLNEGLEHAV